MAEETKTLEDLKHLVDPTLAEAAAETAATLSCRTASASSPAPGTQGTTQFFQPCGI